MNYSTLTEYCPKCRELAAEVRDFQTKIFVKTKGPSHYVKRYTNEEKWRNWFGKRFSNCKIWEALCISYQDYQNIVVGLSKSEPREPREPA